MATKLLAVIDKKCERVDLVPYPKATAAGTIHINTVTDAATGGKTYEFTVDTASLVMNADGSYTWTSADGAATVTIPSLCQALNALPDNGLSVGG